MRTDDNTVSQLGRELNFLDRGGYRVRTSWRGPLFFEDSPICTKQSDHTCPNTCALMSFVPTEYRDEAVPCRHIPLNAAGETLHTMYSTATIEEIEAAIRVWLVGIIGQDESESLQEKKAASKEAA